MIILLHCRLLNGVFLGDVIDFFRSRGWTWIDPATAQPPDEKPESRKS